MCLLEHTFADITSHTYEDTFQISGPAVAELWSIVMLSPLYCTDLRAATADSLVLVDASDEWIASVEAELPPTLGAELERHQLTKAAWAKLLSPLRALQRVHGLFDPCDEVPEGEEPVRAHPLWTSLARGLQFGKPFRRKVRRRTHINLDEMKAALHAEGTQADRRPNSRIALGSDSQVVLGAVIKGRSSSRSLNGLLRQALPRLLGQNCYSFWHYTSTPRTTLQMTPPEIDLFDNLPNHSLSGMQRLRTGILRRWTNGFAVTGLIWLPWLDFPLHLIHYLSYRFLLPNDIYDDESSRGLRGGVRSFLKVVGSPP